MAVLRDIPRFNQISAPSPLDSDKEIVLSIDKGVVEKVGSIAWTNKLYAMSYNILGVIPPTNNAGLHEMESTEEDNSRGIKDAHAVFQGIRRPHIEEGGDESVFVYIIKPKYCYKYIPDMACTTKREPFPEKAVFAVYVNFDQEKDIGEVFNWELLKADPAEPHLPESSEHRYDRRVW